MAATVTVEEECEDAQVDVFWLHLGSFTANYGIPTLSKHTWASGQSLSTLSPPCDGGEPQTAPPSEKLAELLNSHGGCGDIDCSRQTFF